jgi:hypothetical protein
MAFVNINGNIVQGIDPTAVGLNSSFYVPTTAITAGTITTATPWITVTNLPPINFGGISFAFTPEQEIAALKAQIESLKIQLSVKPDPVVVAPTLIVALPVTEAPVKATIPLRALSRKRQQIGLFILDF